MTVDVATHNHAAEDHVLGGVVVLIDLLALRKLRTSPPQFANHAALCDNSGHASPHFAQRIIRAWTQTPAHETWYSMHHRTPHHPWRPARQCLTFLLLSGVALPASGHPNTADVIAAARTATDIADLVVFLRTIVAPSPNSAQRRASQ